MVGHDGHDAVAYSEFDEFSKDIYPHPEMFPPRHLRVQQRCHEKWWLQYEHKSHGRNT